MSILKINIPNGSDQKVWITSDTHYGQNNIVRAVTRWRDGNGQVPIDATRDFKSIDHMNETIVNNINKVVREDDILIHAGDWSFGGIEYIENFGNRINCKTIHIVVGNHDDHILLNHEDVQDMFTSVNTRIDLYYNKTLIVIDHYPLLSWRDINKGSIMLHGHSHSSNNDKIGKGRRCDIGIDGHIEFRPYDLINECIIPMMKIPIVSDHHR